MLATTKLDTAVSRLRLGPGSAIAAWPRRCVSCCASLTDAEVAVNAAFWTCPGCAGG